MARKIWRDTVIEALELLGGEAHLSEIYQSVHRIRNELPRTWQAIVRRELEYNSKDSQSYQERHDLFYSTKGVGEGRWGLWSYLTPPAADLPPEAVSPYATPGKTLVKTYRILRDTALARNLKIAHDNRCQICGTRLLAKNGQGYSEAHHIKPLGAPHHGPDSPDNIIVLCPNHHAQMDLGAISISLGQIKLISGHAISQEFIDYHNQKIAAAPSSDEDHPQSRGS